MSVPNRQRGAGPCARIKSERSEARGWWERCNDVEGSVSISAGVFATLTTYAGMAEPQVRKDRHVKYYLRCLKTFLPQPYISNDSNRGLLAFFTIAGLDLLDALETTTTPEERRGYINWIYHCQVATGGFRGFTGTDFGAERHNTENEVWDPANVAATFLLLVTLLILGDDLSRVNRRGCLQWLPSLQREDGSFGELISVDGRIAGGHDLRFCYCAAGIRYILRGGNGRDVDDIKDVDIEKLLSFIEECQNYDGGMAESPFCEAHAGLTYCAIGALSFLDRLSPGIRKVKIFCPNTTEFESLVQWLVQRQTTTWNTEDVEEEETAKDEVQQLQRDVASLSVNDRIDSLSDLNPPEGDLLRYAGFNGRLNKVADTCYCFWVAGTLAMMDRLHLVDSAGIRNYLLEKTQHIVGGFGKTVGEPPDLLHSYLGLVSLSLLNEPGLESVDAALCASKRTMQRLKSLPWWNGRDTVA
ncbi:geranylgeranyl transferase beta subunit, putative [Paecilomyces variotii No. 5]|uniref:Geranylgeranyl transferase beta subunit, putative n=1 Tax=Byssochlamys spectabilis (strain No. 5 / NBRC 109023) TaxID=1356009 RepID=V5FFM1_BYSSN|nr:geranylgeranyl transferase beta subunit, putative [Paecilomyces variotii No. 5]